MMCDLVTSDCSLYVIAYFWRIGCEKAFFQGSVPFSWKKMSRVTTVVADSFYYNTKPNLNPNCTFEV